MSKKQTEVVERLVLVVDPILGSRYELQNVEIEVIDAVEELNSTLTTELNDTTQE